MKDRPETLEELSTRVDELEKRVQDLESPSLTLAPPAASLGQPALAETTQETGNEPASNLFPVLGRALVGIAGAYALRAIAQSNLVPRQVTAVVAIAYAIAWLVGAARVPSIRLVAATIYAGASALILAPMLWELTLRFHILSPLFAAGVIGIFVVAATWLAWRSDRSPVFWVAQGAAAPTALALAIATRQLIPSLAVLLLMVLLCEYAAVRGRGSAIRPLVAAVTDLAVWALLFIYSRPQSARADYPVLSTAALLAPACLLFLFYGASMAIRTMLLRQKIAVFETIQAVVAFSLAAAGVSLFQPDSGLMILGTACLILSAACYAAVLGLFRRAAEPRNFHVFAVWSAALFLTGLFCSLPLAVAAACLGLAAVAATLLGLRLGCMMLAFHGVIYLAAAAAGSGLLEYAFRALAGSAPVNPTWCAVLVSACALICYVFGKEYAGEGWRQQALHLVPALLAVCAVGAFMAHGLYVLTAQFLNPGPFLVALLRTFTLCSLALALASSGSKWLRPQMTRTAYVLLALLAVKLVTEDLRHGRMEFTAASIFLFAVTLIGVPRMAARARARVKPDLHA